MNAGQKVKPDVKKPLKYISPGCLNLSDNNSNLAIYTGPSMNPTLKATDILHILPYNGGKIKRGDVIVFQNPEGEGKNRITHRVISSDSNGIGTQGDNNCNVDYFLLKPGDVIGKVVSVRRGRRDIRIYGGKIGELTFFKNRAVRRLNRAISVLLHPAYRCLSRTGIFRLWLPSSMKPRVIAVKRPFGTEFQLLIGKHLIGRRLPYNGKWQIRRPFRLFIDEASLLQGKHDN